MRSARAEAIDLNSDLGETWKGAPTADDEAMFALISSASIACGFHAGDDASMRASIERAARFGVAVGAHPSYDDREGFGRRDRSPSPVALRADITRQLDALAAAGADIRYVKPHGALYNRIVDDAVQARAVAAAVAAFAERAGRPIPVLGLGGAIAEATTGVGLPFVREAFLDRAYTPGGALVPRSRPGAVLGSADVVAERAVRLVVDRVLEAIDGTVIAADAASLCVHGDTPAAVAMARAVRAALDAEHVPVRAPW
ncbi:MAG TPA: 5-oxoprolinase subunit PxpA [Microbacterium sp.]|uniref:5-oxoprolinase subunit PxpA n=1 Tax=Microbacterium sp. TaxID=51671 RepID=UPI002C5ECAD4|nr:5-oxoprolinase subunit PxpA [Microbacterium sp.]HWI31421.1 5-oxoprolinase subunit PxpA [Microbacterium sp.]